jgi:hypothetical protein
MHLMSEQQDMGSSPCQNQLGRFPYFCLGGVGVADTTASDKVSSGEVLGSTLPNALYRWRAMHDLLTWCTKGEEL